MPDKKADVPNKIGWFLSGGVPGAYETLFAREKAETNVSRMPILSAFIVATQLLMYLVSVLKPTVVNGGSGHADNVTTISALTLIMGLLFLALSILMRRGVVKNHAVRAAAPYILLYAYMAAQMVLFYLNVQMSGSGGSGIVIALLLTLILIMPPVQSVLTLLALLCLEIAISCGARDAGLGWDALLLTDAWVNTLVITALAAQISVMLYNSYLQNFLSQVRLAGSNQTLEKIARTDSLTELLNRRGFFKELDRNWPEYISRDATTIAACMFDIDYFKRFNDRFGHLTGDQCLRAVGQMLRQELEKEDGTILCRYGGEEFLTVYRGNSPQAVLEAAERARQRVQDMRIPYEGDTQLGVTISGGLACGQGDVNCDELIRLADAALYQAKAQGRNRVCVNEESEVDQ